MRGGAGVKRSTEGRIAAFLRVGFVVLVVVLQIGLMLLLSYYLRGAAIYVYILITVAAVVQIMVMVSRNTNSSYTIAWVLIIALLPVYGLLLYWLWGRSDVKGRRPERLRDAIRRGMGYLRKSYRTYALLNRAHPARKRIAGYLGRSGFSLYQGTSCTYYPLGECQFQAMFDELRRAEKFIFLSTFILNTGRLWDELREILLQRAAAGVEVRLMYDDFGSLLTVPDSLVRQLRAAGVRVVRFGPIHRYISKLYIHYRNHQKITVIDGRVAYTGGTNIADEYANYYPKHGHWKDTAIRLEGAAVWTLTVNYLSMWEGETGDWQDYGAYRAAHTVPDGGFFAPFWDGPVNNPENPAEVMYRQMITGAREYVYVTTPYLVITNNMMEALCTAAQSGVDVRIVTPRVWDHWYVHMVSRSNYKPLLQAGARVFEYSPGFIHAKTILSDDDHAVTGSINMDYRSFYLHFENGVWICGDPVLRDIKRDMLATLAQCEEITLAGYLARPRYIRFVEGVLRVFAVLL